MTDLDPLDHQPELRAPVGPGRHTRVVAALIGCLVSVGVPAVALSTPVPVADGQVAGALEDPAGSVVTGAPPSDLAPADTEPVAAPTTVPDWVFGEPTSIGLPGIPTPELPDGPLGIPGVALDAYQFAEQTLADARPGCRLSWSMLAGIGRIESNHASQGRVDVFGNTLGPILGPQLDGSPGMAAIPDTDHGVLDQDAVWDRAVGPMQFIPASWGSYGVDGNGDGVANPNNLYDATVAAGLYLCTGGANLSDPVQLQGAVFRYNHSASYVSIVLRWAQAYLTNVVPTPSAPGPVPPGTNGNGGAPILPDGASLAAVVAQVISSTPTPTQTPAPTPTLSLESPSPTTAPSPTTTPSLTTTPGPTTTPVPPSATPPGPTSHTPSPPPVSTTESSAPTPTTSPADPTADLPTTPPPSPTPTTPVAPAS